MELLGWFKRVKPVGKRLLRIYANPETELVELVKKSSNATWTKCELDSTNLYNILHILSTLLATGKPEMAANFCRSIAEKCFDDNPENPYRLMFLSFAMVADCETKLYELNFHPLTSQGLSLKRRYSFCQQASAGFADWEPSIFKITDLLTISEEFAHFSCFRQCHVNLLKHLAELKEDDSVDWFDIVKVIDSNILALINDSDVGARLCDTDKEKESSNRIFTK
uniref:Tetratricopeptide repeat protein 30 n=1 Tax=Caenorhabditis tropicalis TaxID=1561998 RepID=A0A1I7URR1_9PELO